MPLCRANFGGKQFLEHHISNEPVGRSPAGGRSSDDVRDSTVFHGDTARPLLHFRACRIHLMVGRCAASLNGDVADLDRVPVGNKRILA